MVEAGTAASKEAAPPVCDRHHKRGGPRFGPRAFSGERKSKGMGAPIRILLALAGAAVAPLGPARAWAACSVSQGDLDGNGSPDVRIVGDARPQRIVISDSQSSYRVQVDCDGNGRFTDPGDIDTGLTAGEI